LSNKVETTRGHAVRVDRCFWLYLLECENGSFYTGYTKNLAIRYYQHKNGKQSARYTRSFKPIKIAQCWRLFDTIGTALKVERFIKNQDRKIKLLLVENPEDLKPRVLKKMEKELILLPFDVQQVEKESAKMDWRKIKSGFDPFADIPMFHKR